MFTNTYIHIHIHIHIHIYIYICIYIYIDNLEEGWGYAMKILCRDVMGTAVPGSEKHLQTQLACMKLRIGD